MLNAPAYRYCNWLLVLTTIVGGLQPLSPPHIIIKEYSLCCLPSFRIVIPELILMNKAWNTEWTNTEWQTQYDELKVMNTTWWQRKIAHIFFSLSFSTERLSQYIYFSRLLYLWWVLADTHIGSFLCHTAIWSYGQMAIIWP